MSRKLKNKYGPWVTGDDFFNRKAEIRLLTKLLGGDNGTNDATGRNLLVVAPRRVGKTSLIRETFRQMGKKNSHYFIFLDIQDCSSPEEVMVALSMGAYQYQTLQKKVMDVFKSLWEQLKHSVETIGAPEFLEIRLREGFKGDWQVKGKQLLENLTKADRPIVICLDELPIMVSRLLKTSSQDTQIFLSWLRQVMGMYQERLSFIICGSIGLEPILKRYGLSHTIAHLQPFPLDAWDRKTAIRCLTLLAETSKLQLEQTMAEKMLDYLGVYVPHHVQMFFGHLYEMLFKQDRTKPNIEDIDTVYKNSMLSTRGHAELADYEERLLRVLSKKTIPLALELLTETAVSRFLTIKNSRLLADRSQLSDKDTTLREVTDVLEHDGYLLWDEDSDGWKFSSYLIRDWWKRRFSQSYVTIDKE
ncbi:MAG: ATP-binding protein [Deltaproteobacteria bacterium]|jgi:hypothetical protein|nr:ATP-binding protein [Deltaproteobacteria bacterium]